MYDFSSSPLLLRRTPGERPTRLTSDLLLPFAIVLFVPLLVSFIPGSLATVILGINALAPFMENAASPSGGLDYEALRAVAETITKSEGYRLVTLFGEAWTVAICLFVCLTVQRRSLATMGVERRGALRRYAVGFLLGALLCSAVVPVLCLSRAATFGGRSGDLGILYLVFIFFGYLIQGAAEELLFHGLLLTSLARRFRWLPSVLFSALFFALMHAVNTGATLLSLLNVFLFGVFLGLFVIRTGSVIGAAALHAAWNWFEGHVFGCAVSGFPSATSIFFVTLEAGRETTNGGAFGPEGGLAATMILMVALIAVLFLPSFKKKSRPTD